jgi:dihydroorotate dehydrogenase
MKHAVRRVTRVGYKRVAKPLLFKLHPDGVHHRLVRTAKIVQKSPIIKELPRLWSHSSRALEQDVLGIHFSNPVGVSAGFDKNIDMPSVLRNVGFGFMVGGSVTARACDGNPRPWFYRLPRTKALVVHAGLPNQGVEYIAQRLAHWPKRLFADFPLSVSVAKTNTKDNVSDKAAIKDYCTSLALLEQRGVCQMYEINISCPNTYGGEPFTTPDRLEELLHDVDKLGLTRPVFVKMPIDKPWNEFRMLLEVAARHNVQGVSIGNLLKDRKHVTLRDDLPDAVKGNLSGMPTQKTSTKLIRQTYSAYGDRFVIIGIGGIFTAADAYEKIKAGSTLVALITGMIFEGPQLVGDINNGLEKLLKADGYTSISQAIGVDAITKNSV